MQTVYMLCRRRRVSNCIFDMVIVMRYKDPASTENGVGGGNIANAPMNIATTQAVTGEVA